jgi:hypothetical protein
MRAELKAKPPGNALHIRVKTGLTVVTAPRYSDAGAGGWRVKLLRRNDLTFCRVSHNFCRGFRPYREGDRT